MLLHLEKILKVNKLVILYSLVCCCDCFDCMLPYSCAKSYLGSQFGIMLPLTSTSATPSRNLDCGFKSMVLELLNSTLRDECTLEKHSSFQDASVELSFYLLYVLQLSPKLLKDSYELS